MRSTESWIGLILELAPNEFALQGPDDPIEGHLDSLAIFELTARIEEAAHVPDLLTDLTIPDLATVGTLARALSTRDAS